MLLYDTMRLNCPMCGAVLRLEEAGTIEIDGKERQLMYGNRIMAGREKRYVCYCGHIFDVSP